jgi:sugar porter (SP) family MFS transporter
LQIKTIPVTPQKNNMAYVIFLSVVAAIGGFLFGFDTAVISGTIGQVSAQFKLNSLEQGWYVGCALLGSIIGVSMAGALSDFYGRKEIMILSAVLFSVSALGCALSENITELVIYRIIGGAGIGMVSIVSPMYISEISISKFRGSLVSLYQLAITVGFLGAFLINYQLLQLAENAGPLESSLMQKIFVEEVWRAMLGMEFIPAILFFVVIFFIPESPRWLLANNLEAKAELVLTQIHYSQEEARYKIKEIYLAMQKAPRQDWRLIFQPGVLKPVWIGVAIAILGQFMGVNAVLYYGPTIFQKSGISDGDALFYQVLVGCVNVFTTVIALIIIDRVGRKKLVYFGVSGMILALLMIGFYFMSGEELGISHLMLLILFLAYIFFTAISISAVIFVLLSEMYPTKIRGLAMSLAGLSLWLGTYLIGQLTPWMLENLTPGGTFFLFAFMCFPYLIIIWKMVPETAGKTLEEIEQYWIDGSGNEKKAKSNKMVS